MKLFVCGMAEVYNLQAAHNPTKILTVISPKTKVHYGEPEWAKAEITRINFDDVEEPDKFGYQPPSLMDVRKIIDWCETVKEDDSVIIHCAAGKSRSTAAMLILLYLKNGRNIQIARDKLLEIRPEASPNKLICAYADDLLKNRNNELFKVAYDMNSKYVINKGQRTDQQVYDDFMERNNVARNKNN